MKTGKQAMAALLLCAALMASGCAAAPTENVPDSEKYPYVQRRAPEVMLDDVLVFADSYDTSNHCQDGYYTISFERYVSRWFDDHVMSAGESIQQYVTVVG